MQGRVIKKVAKKDREKRAERPTKKSQPESADYFALCEKNAVLKLPNGAGWKFVSSLNKLNLVLNRSLNTNNQPVRNEHIHLTGKTKELITVIKWSLKKY